MNWLSGHHHGKHYIGNDDDVDDDDDDDDDGDDDYNEGNLIFCWILSHGSHHFKQLLS